MGADYIPERDHCAGSWMKNFANQLVNQPEVYRTTPSEAAEIAALVHAFRTSVAVVHSPRTRTPIACEQKRVARKAAERLIRPAAQRIRVDPTISSQAKVNIRITLPSKRRRRVAPPEGSPLLIAKAMDTGLLRVLTTDRISGKRAKPDGVIGLQLFERVCPRNADPKSRDTLPWRFVDVFTRSPFLYMPRIEAAGDEVSLTGRWVTRRGERGPFSQPISIIPAFNPAPHLDSLNVIDHRRAA